VADLDQPCGREVIHGSAKKVFSILKCPKFCATNVRYHTKVVGFCRPRKWLLLLVKLCDLSGNQHSL